jgi:hypothetical protein
VASNAPPMLPAASRLAGYEIVGLVGRGGMGEVYRAKQLSMEREVALKILAPRLANDPAFAEQFVAEARAAGKLNHPNIVGVHDVGQASAPEGCSIPAGEPVHYFSMEFIDGETVKDVIERQGAVDLATVGKVMSAMAEALGFAEAHKIVHRDIKPDNIMLTSGGLVKLADLGLALQADSAEAVAGSKDEQGRGKVMGTPLYMAPEQARAHPIDHRADQYALGATLFHMLTGRPPYQGESAKAIMRAHCFDPVPDPAEANPEVPPPWRELCMRMLAKAPEERFAGAAELRAAVKAAVRWKPGTAARAREGRGGGGGGPPWGTIVLVAALVLGGLFYVALRTPAAAPATPVPVVNAPDPNAAVLARAKAELAALPDEPSAALPVIEQLLAEPTLAPARGLILAKRDALRATIEERRRNAMRASADAIEAKITGGQLGEARDGLAQLPDEAWLAERRRRLTEQLATADRAVETRLGAAIDAAATVAICDRLANDITRSGLPDGRRQALSGRLDRRRGELAAHVPTPPKMMKPDSAMLWRELGERCEPLRAALPYGTLVEALRGGARPFPDEDRVLVEALAGFTEAAQAAEVALQMHIGVTKPKVECRFGSRAGTFMLTRLDKDKIGFRLLEVPAESSADRASAVVPWAQLLAGALSGADKPRQTAAFLWYWRQAEARAAVAKLKDETLSTALATYDRRTRPLDIAGEIERRPAGQVVVSYPFAVAKETQYLDAWQGPGGDVGERGLRWTTTTVIAAGSKAEGDLPGLRWKASLKAPLTIEATLQPEAGSEVALVGVTSGDLTVRVGLNPKRQGFYLVTKTDGSGTYDALSSTPPPDYNPNDWSRIRISIDAAGKLSAWLNDKPLTCDRDLTFPPDAKLSPVIQGRAVKQGGGVTLVISQLSVSGKL